MQKVITNKSTRCTRKITQLGLVSSHFVRPTGSSSSILTCTPQTITYMITSFVAETFLIQNPSSQQLALASPQRLRSLSTFPPPTALLEFGRKRITQIHQVRNLMQTIHDVDLAVFYMLLLGSSATEKEGVSWTVTHGDHPAISLFSNPQKLTPGSSTSVGLRKERVSN